MSALILIVLLFVSLPLPVLAATYDNGAFQFDDPGGFYTIRFVFDGSSEPLPVGYELRTEVHPTAGYQQDVWYLNLDLPYTSAIQNWTVTGNLATSVSLARSSGIWSGTWTAVTANPFRMNFNTFYRLSFSVNDPSYGVSGRRPVTFMFALGRQTYPPAIDSFSAYPTAIAPGETVAFACEAHDTGTWGSEYLIFKFDVNNDGSTDHEELGTLNPGEEDAFRGVRRAEVNIKYNNPKIYEALCAVENDRGETTVSAPLSISVGDARLGVVGRPNASGDLETAIIPPDERFPARYHLTLADREGVPLDNRALTVRIDNAPVARLEGGGAVGSEIVITTDALGETEFTYAFLDTPPADAPILDEIVIESVELGIRKTVKVSVGLKLRVMDVVEAWDDGTAVPRLLSLRVALADAFRPDLDLEQYIADLKFETGRHLGVALTTWWLNRPEPDTLQWIADNVKGFATPPDDVLYTSGRGWIKKVNDQFIVNVIDPPMRSVGPHDLPTLTLNGEGLHLFELKLDPVILPEQAGDPSLTIVKSAPSLPFFFGADVYGAESAFKSLVCAFSPTDAEQFLLKAVVLDCPLLSSAQWVGAWASGTAIPYVLLVAEVADLACNFLEGNHLAVGAALAGKYLSRLDSLRESGAIELTESELSLLKKGLVANSIKKFYDTYNDSVKHFMPATPSSFRVPLLAAPLEETSEWPDGLSLADVTEVVEALSAGVMAVPQMQGLEVLAVVGSGPVAIDLIPPEGVAFEAPEVDIVLYETGTASPVLSTAANATLFRILNLSGRAAAVKRYTVEASAENMVLRLATGGDALAMDLDEDGQPDAFIAPEGTADHRFLAADMDLDGAVSLADGLLALRVSAGLATPQELRQILPWAVDVNGDRQVGVAETLYILGHTAGLR